MLRAIIVDDEELSVKRLKRLLAESGQFGVCHTFVNPLEAYKFVQSNTIDVAFLDISMPEINGMRLSSLLHEHDESILVVFVTGYDEFAVQAFDMNALDYLLKPVTAERLSKTIERIRSRLRGMPAGPSITVQLFNGLKITRQDQGGSPVVLRSPKTEELFAFLVCKGAVSREEVIDTLWRDLESEKALKNLNSTLYYIRKAIGSDRTAGGCIVAGRNEIRIDENGIYCDLYEFERLMKQFRQAPERSAELFERAEALYAGEFLKGKAYDWASERTRRIEQNYTELLDAAARFHLKMNEPHKSLHYFEEIVKLDALREDIYHEIIRLYIKLGRRNEALRQYRRLEELLRQELGTKPDLRIKDLIISLT